ncbi:MAG: bifunctional phosphopantothenoylcysteine decarboxylase/phosphopantothenate--cysteine ligase CoaBC [Myxococcales bacterium]|nr:bifunctional phosphopantothenoylcysteine decarboxylase/phosphopantothenate--cysteine ligase CoaBC [Myxococcales bacterium]
MDLTGRRILLGVSGGIAAYKSAELARLFVKAGADVRVMMTRAAQEFVGAATFAALSGNLVATELFDAQQEAQIGHIEMADNAQVIVLAPATANLLARLAHGLADDLVTTVYLAFTGPVVIAPAMNKNMWGHAATQHNVETLRARGHVLVGPGDGEMACGHVGVGRMSEPAQIFEATCAALGVAGELPGELTGRRVLVTAGSTREAIDPVRFIGNRSSGKMGYAIAAEAAARGAEVLLVSGPTALASPAGVTRIDVESASEMAEAVDAHIADRDAAIFAAAVADFTPTARADLKIKKGADGQGMTLELGRTRDILAGVTARADRPRCVVGFAAETGGDLADKARDKRRRKGCDLLVANDVSEAGSGFAGDTNRVLIVGPDDTIDQLPLLTKPQVAARILDRITTFLKPEA